STLLYIIVLLLVSIDVSMLTKLRTKELTKLVTRMNRTKDKIVIYHTYLRRSTSKLNKEIGIIKRNLSESIKVDDYVDCYRQITADYYRRQLFKDFSNALKRIKRDFTVHSIKSLEKWTLCVDTLKQIFKKSGSRKINETCVDPEYTTAKDRKLLRHAISSNEYSIADFNFHLLKYYIHENVFKELNELTDEGNVE
ncbi:hypothetical protein MN116_000212, partial [Schistosoma mekongi]